MECWNTRLTCLDGASSSAKRSNPGTSKVNWASCGGVDFDASGYSLTSKDSKGLGSRTKRGGKVRFVVVVVVTVLVSMHSDTPN